MRIRYQLTERDFALLSLYVYYRRPLNIFVLIAVPVFFVMQLRAADFHPAAIPLFGYLFPLFVLLLIPASVWLGAVRAYGRNKLLGAESVLAIDDDGIHFQIGEATFDYAKEDLHRVTGIGRFKVLTFASRRMHPVPTRAFGASELAELQTLVAGRH